VRLLALAFGLLAVAACAAGAPPPAVSLAPVVAPPVQATAGTLLEECRIAGTGERPPSSGRRLPMLDVYATRDAKDPVLVLARPAEVHVVWSAFPSMPEHGARARSALGGQEHVRFAGFAPLEGTTFSTTNRMVAAHGHLWARAGAPVEMMAASGGLATARVHSPFVAPESFVVVGRCDAMAYEPEEPKHGKPRAPVTDEAVFNRNVSIDLYEAPGGRPFTTITFEMARTVSLGVVERRAGFVRVAYEEDDVGFDAWVPKDETAVDWGGGSGSGRGYGYSSCGGYSSAEHGVLTRDAPLFVGVEPAALSGAVVEKNAKIRYYPYDGRTVGAKTLVPFDFEDFLVRAPHDARMWVARDAIH
jgi:hypothetical protein